MATFDEFAARAAKFYPEATEDDLRAVWEEKTGSKAVRTVGPSLDAFTSRARQLYPDATDEDIQSVYETRYGAPFRTEAWRGVKRSVGAPLLRGLGAMLGGLDLTDYRGLLGSTGERMFNYGNEVAAANAPSREFQEQAWYSPEKLATNTLGALGQVGTMAATLGAGVAPFVVDDAGQMAAELEAKGATRSEAQRIAIPYAIASSALERTGIDRILGRTPGRLITGAVEGGTEVAQDALRDLGTGTLSPSSMGQSLGEAGVPGFLVGALLGRSARNQQDEQDALKTAAGLVDQPIPEQPVQQPQQTPFAESLGGAMPPMYVEPEPVAPQPVAPSPSVPEVLAAPVEPAPAPIPEAAQQIPDVAPAPTPAVPPRVLPPEVAPVPEVGKPPKGEKVPVRVYAKPDGKTVTPTMRAQNPALAPMLDALQQGRGWYMEGRGVTMKNEPDYAGNYEGRQFAHNNHWVPISPWWDDRPAGTTEKKFDAVMAKLRAGKEVTGEIERPIAEWIVEMAEKSTGQFDPGDIGYNATPEDVAEFDSMNLEGVGEGKPRYDQQGRPIPQGQRSLPLDQPQQAPPGSSPEPLSLTPPEGSLRREAKQLAMFSMGGVPQKIEPTQGYRKTISGTASFDFETRPDTTRQDVSSGQKLIDDLIAPENRQQGASVLALRIAREFVSQGGTSLVGQTVRSGRDVAKLAQVYRDPRYETFRVLFMRGDTIIGHSGITSRLPGAVFMPADFNEQVGRMMQNSGADGYYLIHNHPSGRPDASHADKLMTARLAAEVPGFKRHIVLDHNEYANIDARGDSVVVEARDLQSLNFRADPAKNHPSLGRVVMGPGDVAMVIKSLQVKSGMTTIIGVTSDRRVQAIAEYPHAMLRGQRESVTEILSQFAAMSGSGGHLFAVGDSKPTLLTLVHDKQVVDAFDVNGNSITAGRVNRDIRPLEVRRMEQVNESRPGYAADQPQADPGIPPINPEVPGRTEIGGGDYAMNLLKGLTPEQFGALKWAMANLDSKVEAQRRGTRSWDTTMQAAADKVRAEYGISIDTLVGMKAGTTANAEQLATYGMLVAKATQDLEAALKQFKATNSNEDMARAFAARERLAAMMTPFLGAKTEAGRALNILRANAKNFRSAAQIVDSMPENDAAALRRMADRIEHTGSLDQVIGTVQEDYTPDWLDKLLEWRVSMGLLSGVTTHQVNIISNALFNAMDLVAQGAPVLVGKADPRAYHARVAATWHGALVGMSNAVTAFKTETPVLTAGTKVDATHMRAIKGKLGKFARIPVRLLMAEDEFFKSVAYHQHLADLAMSEAIRTNPADPVAAFNRLMGSPVDLINSGIADKARGYADKMTFQTKLGPGLSGLVHGMSRGPGRLWRLVIPFVRTPYNIIKSAFEFTPLAYAQQDVRKAISNGGRDEAVAYARMGIGTAIMGSAIAMAAQGLVTGAGPDDENERRLWLAQGRLPYAVRVGDKWVQYNRFDPMGTIFGVAADMYDLAGYMSEGDIAKLGSAMVTSIALNITDKTFLQGVTDFSEAVSKPDRFMARYVNGIAATAVPNIAAQTARWMDPYQREARNFLDTVKSRVPVMREELTKRIGITGEAVPENSATGLTAGAKVVDAGQNALIDSMLRLGVSKGMPSRDIVIGKVRREVTDEDYEGMAQFVQKARFDALTPIVTSDRFKVLQQNSPEAARAMLEQAWDQIGTKSRMAYLFNNPAVMQRAKAKSTTKSLASKYQEQGR